MKRIAGVVALSFIVALPIVAQVGPKGADLVGTWQLVSAKDMSTGKVTPDTGSAWMQFTKSHWTVIEMEAGRKTTSSADFAKLSPAARMKTNYARIWDDKDEQVFAARGGTYRHVGDKLHHSATMAIYSNIIGVDRVLRITRLDKTALIATTEYPDNPASKFELTYRRID